MTEGIHQQNVLWSLEASGSVSDDVECKLRWVNFRGVSDPRRAFLPALRVTGNTGNKPGSADDKPGSTWERRGQTWEREQYVWEHLKSQ
jgi:hypothetical protein